MKMKKVGYGQARSSEGAAFQGRIPPQLELDQIGHFLHRVIKQGGLKREV